jgi:hypothetical protein
MRIVAQGTYDAARGRSADEETAGLRMGPFELLDVVGARRRARGDDQNE